jgi:cytochrome c556
LSDVSVLQKNCDGCHVDYQAITALTYRAPDFTGIKVTPTLSFTSHMNTLTEQVNAIKIASQDGLPKIALNSLANLNIEMENLGRVCVDCHKKDRKLYPNDQMNVTLKNLEKSLKSGTIKEQSMNLGTLAVQACAQCHGTHRLAFGAKVLLSKEQKLTELIEH